MTRRLISIIVLALSATACGARQAPPPTVVRIVETVEVKVPVPVPVVPPEELLTPIDPPLPVFIAPTAPDASSALTAEGERLLRALIQDLLTRIAAWEAWARSPVVP